MNVTHTLRAEHVEIEHVLDIEEEACRRIEAGGQAPVDVLNDVLEFLHTFVDQGHHFKEEGILFPALECAGFPGEGGPIAVMLDEHETCRALVARMTDAVAALARGDSLATAPFLEAARKHASLMRAHIRKEDKILFPLAERFFDERTKFALRDEFAKADAAHRGFTRTGSRLFGRTQRAATLWPREARNGAQ